MYNLLSTQTLIINQDVITLVLSYYHFIIKKISLVNNEYWNTLISLAY